METIDIYRAANLLIKLYKGDAAAEAVKRMAEHSAFGDLAGSDAWWQISNAVLVLQKQQPTANENVQ